MDNEAVTLLVVKSYVMLFISLLDKIIWSFWVTAHIPRQHQFIVMV